MRIAKFIASAGICSRREAESFISMGRVKLNGNVINSPAINVNQGDIVEFDGKPIQAADITRIWIYYKPVGLVTSHRDEKNRRTVFDQLKDTGLPRVISIGRLDLNSEGLLLLTNDGDFARKLELPINKFDRIYKVRAFGDPTALLKHGNYFNIEGLAYHFKSIKKLGSNDHKNNWFEIVLQEGKNREIRRVFEHFNLQVSRLIRTHYGKYSLGNLKPGEWTEVPCY